MKTNIRDTKRRSFMKIVGLGAVVSASSLFAVNGSRKKGSSTTVELSDQQKETLFFIFQEEKVARDVYITLGEMYSAEKTFANIQVSEQEHLLSAQVLCERYGIDTSSVNISLDKDFVGQFELDSMQALYNECIELGQVSLLEALKVGRSIEIADISDLEKAIEGMPSDVVNTYENLKAGSINHLDSFEKAIARES